ncbi:MAG TPA: DUF1573 domain-containing protein [Deltaproteobacteria bacterium]|nr:DUF1573 domain-containing protein [Deltaproteobacteria bacterium]
MRLLGSALLFTVALLSLGRSQAATEGTDAVPRVHIPQRTVELGRSQPGVKPTGSFTIGNTGSARLNIIELKPSCGCTVAEPETKTIAPGEEVEVTVTIDPRGKAGGYRKTVTVRTDDPEEPVVEVVVTGEVAITEHGEAPDRSAIFTGKCAACHAEPASGKEGEPLFEAVCALCHGHYGLGGPAAARINDLDFVENHDDSYIRTVIADGVSGTSMPAFAKEAGGPLDTGQIESLVELIRWWEEGYVFRDNRNYIGGAR